MKKTFTLLAFTALTCGAFGTSSFAGTLSSALDKDTHKQGSELLIKVVSESEAYQFVQGMTQEGLAFLSDTGLSKAEKRNSFEKLLNNKFDIEAIAKFTAGRYWKQMNASQQSEYLNLFEDMIVDVYSRRFDEYQGQTVTVKGSTPLNDNEAIVKSVINQPSGSDVSVDWRVRGRGGSMKILDVIVEGVSMSVTQRSDFSSVIQRGGGNVDVLLDHLRK